MGKMETVHTHMYELLLEMTSDTVDERNDGMMRLIAARDRAIAEQARQERDAEWARAYYGDGNAESESWVYTQLRDGGPSYLRSLVEAARDMDRENEAELIEQARQDGAREMRERCRETATSVLKQAELSGVADALDDILRALPPLPPAEEEADA